MDMKVSVKLEPEWEDIKPKINLGDLFFDRFGEWLWEMCPLDKSHYCRKGEMQEHLERCKEKFLKQPRKVECPFNPLHIVNLMEIKDHIRTCENRTVQTNSLCDFEPKRETIEGVISEPMNVALEIPNDWEDGKNPESGYNPMQSTRFKEVIRPVPPGLSKSEKKKWKAKERQRWKWLTGETPEKPRPAPYAVPSRFQNFKEVGNERPVLKNGDGDIIGLIDKLGSTNITDPRLNNSSYQAMFHQRHPIMDRINEKIKSLEMLEAKLHEEKLDLKRQVEEYLSEMGTGRNSAVNDFSTGSRNVPSGSRNIFAGVTNRDPRLSSRNQIPNASPVPPTPFHVPNGLPNMMGLSIVR